LENNSCHIHWWWGTMVSPRKEKNKWKRGYGIMTEFISTLLSHDSSSSRFSIAPTTNYRRHVPRSAKQLSEDNWKQTGDSLRRAIKKVGKEIGEE
jgi:hypothetical protein